MKEDLLKIFEDGERKLGDLKFEIRLAQIKLYQEEERFENRKISQSKEIMTAELENTLIGIREEREELHKLRDEILDMFEEKHRDLERKYLCIISDKETA